MVTFMIYVDKLHNLIMQRHNHTYRDTDKLGKYSNEMIHYFST